MKFAAIIATAAASDPRSWLVENWWNEAVNVFNFASNNWATFAAQADKVSREGINRI